MELRTNRLFIRPLKLNDVQSMLDLRIRNRAFLKPFEPLQNETHYTLEAQLDIIERSLDSWQKGTGFPFGIFAVEREQLIGRVNLSNVVRGAWQNCTIGYFLDEAYNGQGLMTEAVRLALGFAFEEVELHRVQAAVMPRNAASIKVLQKAGFKYEGLSRFYLMINGNWEDHQIFSMTKEFWS